jgi:hypothetical protein
VSGSTPPEAFDAAEGPAVLLADKVHNAAAILADSQTVGAALWDRFNDGREGTLWYYRSLADVFAEQLGSCPLTRDLERDEPFGFAV